MKKRVKRKTSSFKKRPWRKTNRKAQEALGMSFGMIVAIMLVIFFIIVAIIVITSLLKTQNCGKIGIFVKNLNEKVDSAWNSDGASFEFVGDLPSDVEQVCFANLDKTLNGDIGMALERLDHDDNLFFYPTGKACNMASHKIAAEDGTPDLNVEEMIQKYGNPFCIKANNGKAKFMIEKENNEKLVRITR